MGFFSDLIGGFIGGGSQDFSLDPKQTLEDTRPYWQQYRQLLSDTEASFKSEYENLDVQVAFGKIPKSAAEARRSEIDSRKEAELNLIREGATANILREEFDFQKQTARAEHDRQVQAALDARQGIQVYAEGQHPNPGDPTKESYSPPSNVYRAPRGDQGDETYDPGTTQFSQGPGFYSTSEQGYRFAGSSRPSVPTFNFASDFESFYLEKMGEPEVEEFSRGSTDTGGSARSARRAAVASGFTGGRAVGIGKVYSIYG